MCLLCLFVELPGMEIVIPHALHVVFQPSSMSGAQGYLSILHNTLFDQSIHVGDCVFMVINDGSLAKLYDNKWRGV